MFNPFKKKDDMDGFQMDNQELPSLNDLDSNPYPNSPNENSSLNDDLPQLPELPDSNQIQQSQPNFESQLESTPGLPDLNSQTSTPTFNQPEPQTQSNPFANEQNAPDSSSANQDLHNELSKARLEAMSNKMELLEHKVNSMDSKLDIILKLINAEVSTETKIKLGLQDKLNNLK